MARQLRIIVPNTFYHVLNRGNERRDIFRDSREYEKCLELMGNLSERYGLKLWSYVLLPNHYHFLVKTSEANLSEAMKWFGTSYTSYFNTRHRRSGHLFQGRFKAFIVEEEDYLKELILYIHRNPIRAGFVRRLSQYKWSSYPCLGHRRACRPWLKRSDVLALFRGGQRGDGKLSTGLA